MISIHALCEEGDVFILFFLLLSKGFLSTPSARRATPVRNGFEAISELFLSTPSARRATHRTVNAFMPSTDFYPRPLRGGRRD